MLDSIALIVLILVLTGLFYFGMQKQFKIVQKVDDGIRNEAEKRNMLVKNIVNPDFSHWKSSPFNSEIKVGTKGFYGFPNKQEYYRILHCEISKENKIYWIRGTYSKGRFSFEWKEANT